jgi:hypothetical protein
MGQGGALGVIWIWVGWAWCQMGQGGALGV